MKEIQHGQQLAVLLRGLGTPEQEKKGLEIVVRGSFSVGPFP